MVLMPSKFLAHLPFIYFVIRILHSPNNPFLQLFNHFIENSKNVFDAIIFHSLVTKVSVVLKYMRMVLKIFKCLFQTFAITIINQNSIFRFYEITGLNYYFFIFIQYLQWS